MAAQPRRAFALVELLALLMAMGLLIAILAVASHRSRHLGWQAGSIANLHEYASVTANYQADYSDQFWSYSWRCGVPTPSQYPDLQPAPSDAFAAMVDQATDILRRRVRPDIPAAFNWAPSALMHNLPLADYLDTRLPMRFVVSPGDRNLLNWSNDIDGFMQGVYLPNQPDPSQSENWRYAYSSSYRVPQAFFSPDALSATTGTIAQSQDTGHYQVLGPTFNPGGRLLSQVNFPSQKVFVFDSAQWQGAKQPVYFGYSFARVPMLLVDGSACVRVTSQANPGFQPSNPRSIFPSTFVFAPVPWGPPAITGASLNSRRRVLLDPWRHPRPRLRRPRTRHQHMVTRF